VGVALDEYGSGFATLGMLKRLPLTAIKLDRALVRELQSNADDAAIARAIIQASRALGFIVIADGVETEAQREFLLACGCDEGQGGLFGQPVPASSLRGATDNAARPDGLAMAGDHRTFGG
jgi:EAL domain-containing protein (putative c-di-GMP-specific phosphodiesterase class I)